MLVEGLCATDGPRNETEEIKKSKVLVVDTGGGHRPSPFTILQEIVEGRAQDARARNELRDGGRPQAVEARWPVSKPAASGMSVPCHEAFQPRFPAPLLPVQRP